LVFIRTGNRIRPGRLVVFLFASLLTLPLFSQSDENILEDEEISPVSVEISPDKIIVGQRFDLTIYADFPAYRTVSIKEPSLPEGIVLAGGPYKSAQTINVGDLLNPQYIKKTRVFYKFKVSRPGFYTINSFTLNDGDIQLVTEPFMFPALAFDERELKYPVFARWNNLPDRIFIGETIPLILEMENLEELSFPERISMSPPSGGVFERVNSLGDISVTSIGDDEVYIAPIDSWLYTPTSTGMVKIPPADVSFNKIERSTGSFSIEVVDLPPQVGLSGAIGNFEVTTDMENIPPQKGATFTVRIRVEGEGNLNFLRMPQPEFSGLTVIEKDEMHKISPSLAGYRGYREDVYRVSIGEEEEISVQFEPWSWYDKESLSVQTESFPGYRFLNESAQNPEAFRSLRDEYSLLSSELILKFRDPVYNVIWYYLLVLPGIISALVALIKKRYDMKILGYTLLLFVLTSSAVSGNPQLREQLEKAENFNNSAELEKAIELYDQLLRDFGDNPGIYYNQALLNYDLEKKDTVIHLLRKSLILKPGNRLFMNLLTSVESEYGLDHQAVISTGLSPDLFFLFFIVLFNMGALIISFNINRKKIELSILSVMVFFLSFASLVVVYYTDFVSMRKTGVIVQSGGDLKKVPGLMGGSWLTLQEGAAVYLMSESEESYLIRTGYGLEGWLHKDSIIPVQEDQL